MATLFPRSLVTHLVCSSSNHVPLLLETNEDAFSDPKPFHFEAMWIRDSFCELVINDSQSFPIRGSPAFWVCKGIKAVKLALKDWNKSHFGLLEVWIKTLQHHPASIQDVDPSLENHAQERNWKIALDEELRAEEVFQKLKSRKDWLTTNDFSTKHFHLSTIIHRRQNAIEFIKDGDGTWMSSCHEIESHIVQHFKTFFSSSDLNLPADLDYLIDPIMSTEENDMLCSIPSNLEILEGIHDIGPHKGAGPDDMTELFFKHYWPIVGSEVTAMVKYFFT